MIALHDIEAARCRIGDSIPVSPCPRSEVLSKLNGHSVYLKLENLQRTGSFKERGALNKILTLRPEECSHGLITASAGNHGQGMAYHATSRGIRAEVWMPRTTPLTKVSATRSFGGNVVLDGGSYDETYTFALERSRAEGLTFIHPFDDDAVIAGQGTVGLELLKQTDVDTLVVPVGGGGLIAGIACAVKETNPGVRVIGVQSEALPSMKAAMATGKPVTVPAAVTIADGIAVRTTGERTLPIVQRYVDEIVTVEEEEIATAILFLLEKERTVAEGAGAVALAALLHNKLSIAGKNVVALVSGGNIDVKTLSRIIERGLTKDGRLITLRIHLPDYPGALHRLTGVIASHEVNIVATSYNRTHYGVALRDTVIDLTLETRGPGHIQELAVALQSAGYDYDHVV
jgi:threonine dehydratase